MPPNFLSAHASSVYIFIDENRSINRLIHRSEAYTETQSTVELQSPSLVGRGIANPQELRADAIFEGFAFYLRSKNKRNVKQIVS